jgi:hypothetical protein
MTTRHAYDIPFGAAALSLLRAAGYPAQRGALIGVSRALGVPVATLRRWAAAPDPGEAFSSPRPDGVRLPLSCPALPGSLRSERGTGALTKDSELQVGICAPRAEVNPLPDAVRGELLATVRSMAAARGEASYKELSAGFAVLADRLPVLETPSGGAAEADTGEARQRLARLLDDATNAHPHAEDAA